MKDKIALVVIALIVVIVGAAVIYGRSLVRTDRERRTNQRLRVEDAEREEAWQKMKDDAPIQPAIPQDEIITEWKAKKAAVRREAGVILKDDDTKTWPGPGAMA